MRCSRVPSGFCLVDSTGGSGLKLSGRHPKPLKPSFLGGRSSCGLGAGSLRRSGNVFAPDDRWAESYPKEREATSISASAAVASGREF